MSYIVPLVGAAVVAAIDGTWCTWWRRARALARARAHVVVAVAQPTVRARVLSDDELARRSVGLRVSTTRWSGCVSARSATRRWRPEAAVRLRGPLAGRRACRSSPHG